MNRVETKMKALKCAKEALKKYSRRSNAAKEVERQALNVILADGCEVLLMDKIKQLYARYAKKSGPK